ncbi:MAG: diguanylate cyclase [Candidatus Obscuribacterales bacterium]|nr:diguanylate cyclase [Candidatus Obscuribacterales bacterium]
MTRIVLVVEKDKQLAKLVSSILTEEAFEVLSSDSAAEALVLAEKAELICLGEELSDIDGLGLLAKLKDRGSKATRVFIARQWRQAEFYKTLKEELSVSLIVHRPLRSSVFSTQLLGLLSETEGSALEVALIASSSPLPRVEAQTGGGSALASAEFENLRTRFLLSIPDRLNKLDSALKSTSNGSFNKQILETAITLAHNLKGSSLSWGLEDLGTTAGSMEAALKNCFGAEENRLKELLDVCAKLFQNMQKQAEIVKTQFPPSDSKSNAEADTEESDLSAAKVLIVSNDPPPSNRGRTESGLQVDFIHAFSEDAIEKAEEFLLDAALIEIGPQSSSSGLARRLRDIKGYENLPLGFISNPQAADARADAAHAGSSLFLSKPLEKELVQKVISQLISMRDGGRFRVLVVDDDQDLAQLTSRCLGQFGMLTRIVNDPLLVNDVLDEFNPDLILLDVNMPGMSGFEVCRGLRASARWRDIPILFLTAQTDLNSRLTAYEAGADDYLPKPVINVELLTRVKVRLERARELKERSERDLLTGLLLRRAFSEQIESLISESQRYNFQFCLCLLDVDHFKQVNDKYGHQSGDEVLSALGRLLRKRFRVEDLRGRWGGEEFILAFKHEQKELMQLALQRILDELGQLEFQGEKGEIFKVSFSAGLSIFPAEANNLQDLVRVADRRLYLAKERGRKQIVIND